MSIRIENYTKIIKGNTVLDDVTIEFDKGKIYGIKGKNGSGKTMLLRAICGLINPTDGQIFIDDKLIGKSMSFPSNIGILIENPSFINQYTALENLQLLNGIQKKATKEEIIKLLNKVGLDPYSKKNYKKFSLGMKQRLGIAAAIMGNPEIILLDEPTNAIDQSGLTAIHELLIEQRDRNAVVIVTSHDMDELKILADEIITMSEGKIQQTETTL